MPKPTKIFNNAEEYFNDYNYITNSHLKAYDLCPWLYSEKKAGKVEDIEKSYFIYGKLVDAVLSGLNFEDFFYIGSKKTAEEIKECMDVVEQEIKDRAVEGKRPLKSKTDRLEKLTADYEFAKKNEGKIAITDTVFAHAMETVAELKSQPLYEAFKFCEKQTIIATEINGVKVKCMIDKLDTKNVILNDDKTTANMTTFDPDMYAQQLAWYRWIVREVHGVTVDCYLSVGDKKTDFKRSAFYFFTHARLDYQEELNKELLQRFLAEKDFTPCVELVPLSERETVRAQKCWNCDHYANCEHSRQKTFIVV